MHIRQENNHRKTNGNSSGPYVKLAYSSDDVEKPAIRRSELCRYIAEVALHLKGMTEGTDQQLLPFLLGLVVVEASLEAMRLMPAH